MHLTTLLVAVASAKLPAPTKLHFVSTPANHIELSTEFAPSVSTNISFPFSTSSSSAFSGVRATECSSGINDDARTSDGKLALVITPYQGTLGDNAQCPASSGYQHTNFQIDEGSISINGGDSFVAYRVHSPNDTPSSFQAGSGQLVYIEVPVGQAAYKMVTDLNSGSQIVVLGYTTS